jgi:hypothetical protein
VQEAIYDPKSLLDETNFYNQRQGAPSELTRRLTHIMGRYTNQFPLTLMTVGAKGYDKTRQAVELDDVQFTYPVASKDSRVSSTVKTDYVAGDHPGKGGAPFYLYFGDAWIKRFYILQSQNGVQVYVLEDGKEQPDGSVRYQVQLDPADPDEYCAVTETEAGINWVDITTAVAESESRTTEMGMTMPGLFKNQMGFLRHGMSWAGNASKKVMKINIDVEGESFNLWMDWFMWQFEKKWNSILEHNGWYSRYNRRADGTIALKDLMTGKVIPRGSGILEQIRNRSTYAKLTYDILSNKIGDALFCQTGGEKPAITLMTGTGGMREFDRAMKEAGAKLLTDFTGVADKFLTGNNYNLMLGGFFDGFYHIDGYMIKVKHNPVYDAGQVAQASRKHPESGLPIESYRMTFLDDNDYDGQVNIQHVNQKGRRFLHGVVGGLTDAPPSIKAMSGQFNVADGELKQLSTDVDRSSYTRMSSAGWQIMHAERCFDLQCVLS